MIGGGSATKDVLFLVSLVLVIARCADPAHSLFEMGPARSVRQAMIADETESDTTAFADSKIMLGEQGLELVSMTPRDYTLTTTTASRSRMARGSDDTYHFLLSSKTMHVNPCTPNPCENNGKCLLGDRGSICICEEPWRGKFCDVRTFQDKASCRCDYANQQCIFDMLHQDYHCECRVGLTGDDCSILANPCFDTESCHPNNTASCVFVGDKAHCQCLNGFDGVQCGKQWQDPCATVSTRHGHLPHFVMRRPANISKYVACTGRQISFKSCDDGQYFEPEFNRCVDMVQKDALSCAKGSCLHGLCDEGRCSCDPGFTGHQCNIEIDPCSNRTCGGGQCVRGESQQYYCRCPNNKVGISCSHVYPNPCRQQPVGRSVEVPWNPDLFAICYSKTLLNIRRCPNGEIWNSGFGNCQMKQDGKTSLLSSEFVCKPNVCKNGGMCRPHTTPGMTPHVSTTICMCQPGTEGAYCQIITDPCLRDPCQQQLNGINSSGGGGVVVCKRISKNGYVCLCRAGRLVIDGPCPNEDDPDDVETIPETFERISLTDPTVVADVGLLVIYPANSPIRDPSTRDSERAKYVQVSNSTASVEAQYHGNCPWPARRSSPGGFCYLPAYYNAWNHMLAHPLIWLSQYIDTENRNAVKSASTVRSDTTMKNDGDLDEDLETATSLGVQQVSDLLVQQVALLEHPNSEASTTTVPITKLSKTLSLYPWKPMPSFQAFAIPDDDDDDDDNLTVSTESEIVRANQSVTTSDHPSDQKPIDREALKSIQSIFRFITYRSNSDECVILNVAFVYLFTSYFLLLIC